MVFCIKKVRPALFLLFSMCQFFSIAHGECPIDRLDKPSYARTNILPMVKWRNCKALCSTVLKQEGLQAWRLNVRWSDGSIGSVGQAILRSDKYYRPRNVCEVDWTAIGTKFAPAYASIFMYVLETRMLKECEFKPWVWWRFLYDIFFI